MPVDFSNVINLCKLLSYNVPTSSTNYYAGDVKLDNCFFGKYDSRSNSFILPRVNATINWAVNNNKATKCVIILGESPHKYEFDFSQPGKIGTKWPLMRSHNLIENRFAHQLSLHNLSLNGIYDVYLFNSVQYQCSFGQNLTSQKDLVFALTWNTEPAYTDLLNEINSLVSFYHQCTGFQLVVINSCTKSLKNFCMTDLLRLSLNTN